MLPDGWKNLALADICKKSISYGIVQTGDSVHGGVLCVRVVDLTKREISTNEMITTTKEISQSYKKTILEKNEIMFALRGEVGLSRMVSDSLVGANLTRGIARLSPKESIVDPYYLLWAVRSPKFRADLIRRVGGSALQEIGIGELRRVITWIPPLPEQQKIAQILSIWDKAIEKLEALIAAKQKRKKALMQQLLTGNVRFAGFDGEWKNVKIKDCAECLDNRRVPLNNEERLKRQGVIPYWGANGIVDYINEYIFDESIVLLAEDGGYFDEYSSRPIANISYGKSWVNNHAHVLRAKSNALNEWLYFSLVHKNILAFVNGGTRAKLNNKAMLMIHILLPPIEEQQKITTVLSDADKEITTHQNQLAALKQQKTGLMQQLLTGKKRVKVSEAG